MRKLTLLLASLPAGPARNALVTETRSETSIDSGVTDSKFEAAWPKTDRNPVLYPLSRAAEIDDGANLTFYG